MKKKKLLKLMSFWPPFLGAGVSVDFIADDFSQIDVSLKMRFWNKNYVNTHFGGSLYSMTDPFYMLMLLERLGPKYIVWDKAAAINFKKPGIGRVHCRFEISDERIADLKLELESTEKIYPKFIVDVLNDKNEVVCTVEKTLYIKRK